MIHKRFVLTALLLALTLVLVPACGDEEEPAAPDAGQEKPAVADVGDPGAEPPAPPKLWKFDGDSLAGYIAAVKDLKENAPKALRDATENAITMAYRITYPRRAGRISSEVGPPAPAPPSWLSGGRTGSGNP